MGIENRFKQIYYRMLQTRFLEEALIDENKKGTLPGQVHLCIGQEAASVSACAALRREDIITCTHRGHGQYIGKGIDLKKLCCEIWGKSEGYGKGRAGHMTVFDIEHGILGGTGIVAGNLPIAVGQALAFKLKREKRVALSFFGDGAANTGSFHEALNMAAKWNLPVVFFCENNHYGLTVHVSDHLSVKNVAIRSKAYDVPGHTIFGNDMVEVYKTVEKAVMRARSAKGPSLIEAVTYRIHGFASADTGGYQKEEEMGFWKGKDPINIAERFLTDKMNCTEEEIATLRKEALAEINEAIDYALNASFPDFLDLPNDLFAGGVV